MRWNLLLSVLHVVRSSLLGLAWSVVKACMWGSQGSSQGVPGGLNNRTKVNFVVEEVVLVSSGIILHLHWVILHLHPLA